MKRTVNKLMKLLKEKSFSIVLAESVTCGLASHQLSTVKGTSEVFKGSIVCYDERVKISLLKINPDLIKKYTAESQQVTNALAKNLSKIFDADVYAAITGLAANGGSETKNKPVGTIFFSVFYKGKSHRHNRLFKGTPLKIKKKACEELYAFIIKVLKTS